MKKKEALMCKITKTVELYEENPEIYRSVCAIILDFLLALITADEDESNVNIPVR
jgi:hypothetical protein